MPTLPVISVRELIACLASIGYQRMRQKGSHVRLECPGRAPLTVPLHDELDRGTLRSILRAAGVSVDDLLRMLGRG